MVVSSMGAGAGPSAIGVTFGADAIALAPSQSGD